MSLNRRYGQPILVPDDGERITPTRLALTDKSVDEKGWLQNVIASTPAILPIAEIEPAFAPPILAGMEVPTDVGPIDNLYLSPSGYITLVETKLWRNPEARREVVGQIIDYAKELSRWSFEDLEKAVRSSEQLGDEPSPGVVETMRRFEPIESAQESVIIDTINRNFQRGRLLLLIVGDGIRESVEAMADFLPQTPQLHFTLGLVELELYELSVAKQSYRMVIPHVVARTREITRAVVHVEATSDDGVQVGVETPPDTAKSRARSTLTEEDFFQELSNEVDQDDVEFARAVLDDMQERGFVIDWPGASFVVKLRDPRRSGRLQSLFHVYRDGTVDIGWLAGQLESLGLSPDIAYEFARESADLFGVKVKPKDRSSWRGTITIGQLRAAYDNFAALVERTAQKIRDASEGTSDNSA
jgi:hypothetical protein